MSAQKKIFVKIYLLRKQSFRIKGYHFVRGIDLLSNLTVFVRGMLLLRTIEADTELNV